MEVKEKSVELEKMFEEMFNPTKQDEPKQDQPKQDEPKQWPRLGGVMVDITDTYKESGLKCSTCHSNDASYSPHYKNQWCLNCWF